MHHVIQELLEVFKTRSRYDDGVPPTADVFGDPEKAPTRILLEREHKGLPFDLNFVCLQSVFLNRWLW